ncbi:MAG: MmgE/PrpD family protein [Nitrospirales bacterium]|nr:MmgE/PrpD family protein [Nitrospirales bacterium]
MMLADRLAEYAGSLTFQSLSQEVIHEVKRRVLDSLACAYGAISAPPCRIARRLANGVVVKGGATVWGIRHRTTPDLAAFANGTAVRYLDCNDTYLSKEPAHPSDNIPACLAVAESLHVHGRQFIEAIVLAYEVQCRLCDAAALRPRGWDHVTYGAFSTAIATARLLKLPHKQIVHALNLAGITAGALRQTRVGEVSLWKACAFANASRNGIFAGYAAREGMTGPGAMFEGEKGFMNVISGPFALPEMGGSHGSFHKILDTYIKPHPVEYHAQSAVEAAFAIREQLIATYGECPVHRITSILIGSGEVAIEIIGRDQEKWHPRTRETADHSLPFCVAIALTDGTISPQSFDRPRLNDTVLLDLMQKVRVEEVKAFSEGYPDAMSTKIDVTMTEGKTFTAQIDHPRGHPRRPLSDRELELKFQKLTSRKIGRKDISNVIQTVWELDNLKDINALVSALPVMDK